MWKLAGANAFVVASHCLSAHHGLFAGMAVDTKRGFQNWSAAFID